jgi:F-type H+-transporting ATPase subunit epsilon
MVRAALKEPAKAKAKAREIIYFRQALWKDGQPQKQGEQPALLVRVLPGCV